MAADWKQGARGGAAAARSRAVRPTRAQQVQKAKGQPAMLVNLRIVMSATVATILLLLLAFGAIGLLFVARAPQQPIAARLDLSPPLVPPAKFDPPVKETRTKPVPVPAPAAQKKQDEAPPPLVKKDEAPSPKKKETAVVPQVAPPVVPMEPEVTATIPPKEQQTELQRQKKQIVKQPQRNVRRAPQKKAEPQYSNPLMQLFGIKQ